jgi:hypothetical protein
MNSPKLIGWWRFSLLPLGLLCLSSQLGLPAFSTLLPAFLSLLPTSGVPLSSGKRLQSGELLALIVLVGGESGPNGGIAGYISQWLGLTSLSHYLVS